MIETCVDGSNESARKGCNSLVGREWKGKGRSLENLGVKLCVAEDEKFWCAREELQKRCREKRGCGRQMETTRKGEKVKDSRVGQ
jgi:hypothetical protein